MITKFFKSIRFRIMSAISLVLVVVFILIGKLILSKTEEKLTASFDRSLKSRAEYLISRVSLHPVILPVAALGEEICIVNEYYDTKDTLYKSAAFPDSTIIGKDSLENFRLVSIDNEDPDNIESRVILTLAFPVSELKNDIYNLQLFFMAGLAVSVAVVFFTGYFVSSWLLKPIKNISQRAKNIVSAETIMLLPLPESRDELHELTGTINGMLQRIKENADLQKNFFASAAHELRTPLAVMKTGIEVNLNNPEIAAENKTFLSGQLDDINRLSRLLEDFLLISRSEAHITLRKEKVSLIFFIEQLIQKSTSLSNDYGVKVNVSSDFTNNPSIVTDYIKLEHILLNLFENAIKYTSPGSAIEFMVEHSTSEQYTFTVQNSTLQEKGEVMQLFDAFYQGDPFKDGHGLGLWISNRLAIMIDAQLEIQWHDFTFKAILKVKDLLVV